jgi:hypothetical protein
MKFGVEFLRNPQFNSGHKQIYIPNVTLVLNVREYSFKKSTQNPVKNV